MNRLDLSEFRERAGAFDAAVEATPGVCGFCSGSLWQLAAHDHLHGTAPERRHLLLERDGTWLAFAEQEPSGVLLPLEAAWMFGCPLAGDPGAALALLLDAARAERDTSGRPFVVFLGGMVRGGAMHLAALQTLSGRGRGLRQHECTDAMRIDLDEGVEAWLARRSRKFRRSLGEPATAPPGVSFEDASRGEPDELFERILAVQRRSYKWREGADIFQLPEYREFYRALLRGLRNGGGLRLLFARRDGEDLAHIFGGVAGRRYRGLQMSYIEAARDFGLGNRLQLENLRLCAAEGIVDYDLGMPAPYKERWADRREERVGLLWAG